MHFGKHYIPMRTKQKNTGRANGNEYTIVYDRETKIEYMLTNVGLFPLYDVWGRFKTYEVPQ